MRTYPRTTLLEAQLFGSGPYWALGCTIQLAESFDVNKHLCVTVPF